ncbi:hypothetical protein MYP_190 [Sporocytophaga myxococcoides]|uniref:Uncharacterized protein n=1 Tax=Sporocytophaga myxococcoides TaxID=153721 RepID=A0A098L9C4_9BACT|nr:hypothetical protein [Sporocytophaga myxococcoides]GAL82964.1 hypothetical protein MYP_190 [Sporocytophaga myxococcoides]
MKKLFTLLLTMSSVIFTVLAQDNLLQSGEVVWYGIDFSHSKFIGEFSQFSEAGTKSSQEIQVKYFPAWNNIVINEPDKYNIKKFYGFDEVIFDLNLVKKNNEAADIDAIFDQSKPNDLSPEKIQKMISSYHISGKKGLGLVFIVDNFNKIEEQGNIYVTFFDLATKKVIATNLYGGKPGGFGIKNYWARVIYNVMETSGKEFKKIKKGKK